VHKLKFAVTALGVISDVSRRPFCALIVLVMISNGLALNEVKRREVSKISKVSSGQWIDSVESVYNMAMSSRVSKFSAAD